MINLNALLKHAITSARDDESLTIEQIIANVLANDPVCVDLLTISTGNDKGKKPAAKESKTRTRTAPPKPRSVPDDDVRCSARSFYENQHLEDGLLKVMRDDADNLYGDRCKFKKTGDINFCKHHAEKQVLGVWGGEYSGKFKTAVEKTESGVVPEKKPVAPKESKPKPKVATPAPAPKSDEYALETDDEEDEEAKPVAEKPKSKPAPKIEEPVADADAEVEDVEIDGVSYLIDPSDGTVYDPESEEEVGRYNIKTKKWIVKPTA